MGDQELDEFAPRSNKRASRLSLSASKKQRVATTNSAIKQHRSGSKQQHKPKSTHTSIGHPHRPSRAAAELSNDAAHAPHVAEERCCPICGQDLNKISGTKLGRQAHVNACLDSAMSDHTAEQPGPHTSHPTPNDQQQNQQVTAQSNWCIDTATAEAAPETAATASGSACVRSWCDAAAGAAVPLASQGCRFVAGTVHPLDMQSLSVNHSC